MSLSRALLVVGVLVSATRLAAVYAPIPEVEQGKALTFYVTTGAYYDTNVFGGPTDRIDSMLYQLSPSVAFNLSATDQTFFSARYQLSLDHVAERPGDKTLDSHSFSARLAHTFSPIFEAELNETYKITKNPESLLPGLAGGSGTGATSADPVVLSTDQSFVLNQVDGRLAANVTRRTGVTLKFRTAQFAYDTAGLARELDRGEHLVGLSVTHAVLPEAQAVAEYRHQIIRYDFQAERKDKDSDFALTGVDYVLTERLALSGRLGAEHRRRKGERSETQPYVELGGKFDYAKGSYAAAGYSFSTEEVSNLDRYTDMNVHRFFMNVQHVLTPQVVATAAIDWAPSKLNGRAPQIDPSGGPLVLSPDRDETNTKVGLALIYKTGGRWSVSATLDRDVIASEDDSRDLRRTRVGVNARWVF